MNKTIVLIFRRWEVRVMGHCDQGKCWQWESTHRINLRIMCKLLSTTSSQL